MSTFGKALPINLFGESHGKALGIIINNLPAGIKLDMTRIDNELLKRRPKSNLSTQRQEKDEYNFVSGLFNGRTTGTPLTVMIQNIDTKPKDYTPNILRPSHADFTANHKYRGHQDYRGGGHFSGRITAPLVILGAICMQILEQKGITLASHIYSIKDIKDNTFSKDEPSQEMLESLQQSDFPTLNKEVTQVFKDLILDAKSNLDSVGGIVETAIIGLSPGFGNPFFDSVESILAHLVFSIPAVKGIEFGKGFDITRQFGSDANDPFVMDNGTIKTSTNNSGGIQGGISNGMPIIFRTAIKPTASIGKEQKTVDIEKMENITLNLKGRHDPCIVHRVIHVINAITAYGILETIVEKEGTSWII